MEIETTMAGGSVSGAGARSFAECGGGDDAVDVRVKFCDVGNYAPVAARLATAVRRELGVGVRLIPFRDGCFEVFVDGRLVFSKKATYRFPDSDEVFYHVRAAQAVRRKAAHCLS